MTKATVKQIADALGDDQIAAACEVGVHSVRNARWQGQFPASWWLAVSDMCRARGVECPEYAFRFKSPADAPASGAE